MPARTVVLIVSTKICYSMRDTDYNGTISVRMPTS